METTTAPQVVPAPPQSDRPAKRKRAPLVFGGLAGLAAIAGTVFGLLTYGKESTDDAQVEGHVMTVAARIPGQVARVLVEDNQAVNAGQVIVELDKEELSARLDAAQADVASAEASLSLAQAQLALTERNIAANLKQAHGGLSQAASGVESSKAQQDQARADMAAAESRIKFAKVDLDRVKTLLASGSVTQAEVDGRQAAFDQAVANLEQARAHVENTKAGIAGNYAGVEQAQGRLAAADTGPQQVDAAEASVQLAQARLKQTRAAAELAELNLSYATIRAPVRGVVSRRNVEAGNLVSPELPLLAVVPLEDVWIVANFKEDQIGEMRAGQRASIRLDTFGRRTFAGHVESIAGGTGARFALLPPDNASGNFVKVVQRVPVLIRIDDRAGLEFRPGLSADVTVTVR
ncbi:MAG: HlyD family secretion protein [Deltaproteobacteria bacterium]|nr:HlyD family secretion protein [Deltaproteobacteria bacterium]